MVSKLFTQNCYLLSWRIEPGPFWHMVLFALSFFFLIWKSPYWGGAFDKEVAKSGVCLCHCIHSFNGLGCLLH